MLSRRVRVSSRPLISSVLISKHSTVHDYNVLMKDFPLNELLAATDLQKLQESVHMVFGHLNKKLKLSCVYTQ